MPPKKAPLAERDANATPKKASGTKKSSASKDKSATAVGSDPAAPEVANKTPPSSHKKRSREEEEQGTKEASAKKAKTDKPTGSGSGSSSKKKDDSSQFDVSGITLDGESDHKVPIFDTCNDIRTKIKAHTNKPGQSMASFGRTISETFTIANNPRTISGPSVKKFLEKKGPIGGAKTDTYYAAYVYFEKLRVKENKPKSKKRLEMEKAHGPEGVSTDVDSNSNFTTLPGEKPRIDNLGVVTFG